MRRAISTAVLMVLVGTVGFLLGRSSEPKHAAAADAPKAPTLPSVAGDVEHMKGFLSDQSHAMSDVGYHYSQLWFAAEHGNWPLAVFYFNETKSHLHWAVRIIPKRKDNAGKEIDLEQILASLENKPLKELEATIATKNKAEFEKSYRGTLEACYACHKAADKPYLRPQVPVAPAAPIINFDPAADWPK